MSLLYRGMFKFQRPGTWFPRAWFASGDTVYLIEENEQNFITIHTLNSETLKWSRFALNIDGEHRYKFGEPDHPVHVRLITNEFLIVYTVNLKLDIPSSRLFKIDINTGELKKWRFHDHPLEGKDAVIVNQCLYAFQHFGSVARSEFITFDLTTDNAQWTPPTRFELPLDMVGSHKFVLANLTYGVDVYWLCKQVFVEPFPGSKPRRIEKFRLYKFSTLTRQVTKINEEFDTAFAIHYLLLDAPFVIDDELYYVFSEHETDLSWMRTYNVSSKKWKKLDIPDVGKFVNVCFVDSQLFIFQFIINCRKNEIENEVGVIALSPSLQELCEVAVIKHKLDTSELTRILKERLKRYTNILGL